MWVGRGWLVPVFVIGALLLSAATPVAHAATRPLRSRVAALTRPVDDVSAAPSLRSDASHGIEPLAATEEEGGETISLVGPASDRVTHLPGYGPPPHPQWSGFLDAGAAEPGTKLHYWFARCSAADYATRPTVLWLNGGPGSSSLLGFLQENGPLLVNRTGGLMANPWAWTLEANMIALESPAGVGYSYCEAQLSGGQGSFLMDHHRHRLESSGLLTEAARPARRAREWCERNRRHV